MTNMGIVLNKNCHLWSARNNEVKFVWIFPALGPRFRVRCPYYRGYFYRECRMDISPGPSKLFVLKSCPCYRGVRKERFDVFKVAQNSFQHLYLDGSL